MTAQRSRFVLAADIGGTSMRAALVDAEGVIHARQSTATEPERGIEDAAERLGALLLAVGAAAPADPIGVGLATAGPIEPSTGRYQHPPNMPGWHGRSMRRALEAMTGLEVTVAHDATAAAQAERRFGAGRDLDDLVYITVSTGIGAGIIANGRPLTGASGGAGEFGHLIVRPGGPACGAGCAGCLEGTASGSALAAIAGERIASGVASSLPSVPTAADVFAAAEAGDELSSELVSDAIEALAAGIASLLNLLDPALVTLGGGVMQGLELRWDDLVAAVRASALPRYEASLPLALTELGDEIGLLGAAVVAFDAAVERG
jgi:glucokinase